MCRRTGSAPWRRAAHALVLLRAESAPPRRRRLAREDDGAGLSKEGLDQIDKPNLKATYTKIRDRISEGESFSDALAGFPRYFSNIYVNMVNAGEQFIVLQSGKNRASYLPDIPNWFEFAKTERAKKLLRALNGLHETGRTLSTTPGIPPERLAYLRQAFEKVKPHYPDATRREGREVFLVCLRRRA